MVARHAAVPLDVVERDAPEVDEAGLVPALRNGEVVGVHPHTFPEESEDDLDDSSAEQIKIERPQTFCHKCSTQFRQFSSFLAHKKFYCKDD